MLPFHPSLAAAAVHAPRRALTLAAVTSSSRRGVTAQCFDVCSRRRYSIPATPHLSTTHADALDQWISTEKRLTLRDTLRPEHVADLYISLPTRDGSRRAATTVSVPPQEGAELGYGHHFVFFHPRNPEKALRADGTDADFCPPEPFTRRMWAGGRMEWKKPLLVGERATSVSSITTVDKKGFETGTPMVFVKQKIEYRKEGESEVCIEEERSHVYLATASKRKGAKEVKDLPRPDFTLEFLPTPTTLFRFSALSFNGHYIHLDKDYAQKSEGYPERLVHGPLTALMLLDTTAIHLPRASFKSFEYRAVNPIPVNRLVTISGTQEGKGTVRVWAEVEDPERGSKVVGMTGKITLDV